MPRPVSWLPRLHEIIRRVRNSVRSHYDRRDLEQLFELQPRAAQLLLEAVPTVEVGRAHLVEREALLGFLKEVGAVEDVPALLKNRRTQKALPTRRKLRTLVRRDTEPVSLTSLPESIRLSRCRLEVSFRTLEDLAQSLYALALAIESDGDTMARFYEVEPEPNTEVEGESDDIAVLWRELEAMETERAIS